MKNISSLVMLFSTLTILVAVSSSPVYAQENMTESDMPKFFAIQHAQSGSISEINATAYTLELNDVSDKTILFSDRPDRIVMSTSTSNFIGNWSVGEDSFVVDAPNAVLIVDKLGRGQDIVIAELSNPIYEHDSNKLKYDFIFLNTTNLLTDSFKFETNTLLIDLKFSSQGITQVGDTISNLINQVNTMKNSAIGRK